jgi:hypothetical protein
MFMTDWCALFTPPPQTGQKAYTSVISILFDVSHLSFNFLCLPPALDMYLYGNSMSSFSGPDLVGREQPVHRWRVRLDRRHTLHLHPVVRPPTGRENAHRAARALSRHQLYGPGDVG